MGEIADMMLDGTLCEGCGVYLEGDGDGIPRYCSSCRRIQGPGPSMKVACPTCGRKVKAVGLKDHQRDTHKEPSDAPRS
jgi:hypothetical protein